MAAGASRLGADVRPCADMRYWHFAFFRFMLGPLARPAQAAALAAPPTPQAARSYPRDFKFNDKLHASRGARSIPPMPSGWMAGLFGDQPPSGKPADSIQPA